MLENVATTIKVNFRTGQSSSDVCCPIDNNPKDDWRSMGYTNGSGKDDHHEEMPDALDIGLKAQNGLSCFVLRAISEVNP